MAEPPALEARGIVKSYSSGEQTVSVLKGLDLAVSAGEFVVILGPSGSGKSTLLNILGLMDDPTEGEVLFSGRSASSLSERQKARMRNERLGFVFQFDALLPEFTVLENVTMPARIQGKSTARLSKAEKRARELLARLGLEHLAERFPSQVSGGERQRVALCRSLINRPAALLADELTGNLDKPNAELVFRDLKRLAEEDGAAVILVTHNPAACDFAARVLHIVDGKIHLEAPRNP